MAYDARREAERDKIVPLRRAATPEIGNRSLARPLVRIHLLGAMQATTYLGDEVLPRGRKARAILGYLGLASGARIPRARLAAMLWDRAPDDRAGKSFRHALRELTSAMGPLADELLSVNRANIRLDTSLCWIDAVGLLEPPATAPDTIRSDLAALCAGELLEEMDGVSASFDQWLLHERARFGEQLRILLEVELTRIAQSGQDASKRANAARRLIAVDPTHEAASRALMRALSEMGERAQALREYERCCEAARKLLDAEPSRETQTLYQAIRTFPNHRDRDENASGSTVPPRQSSRSLSHPAVSTRPRVGVLPFLAVHSPEEEGLAFSLSQEIAAALARFRWFDVIAPVSLARGAFRVPKLARRAQPDYVVDGALSRNGEHFQISVRLLDLAGDARPVWSDRFRLAAGELHELEELVTARIVGQIDPIILFIEGQPRRREHYGATGLLLLAMPLMYSMEREKYEQAHQLIDQALEIDPDNAMACAWAAYWQVFHVGQGWAEDPAQAMASAQEHALRAIRLDPENAEALGIYAHICSFLNKDFDSAVHYFDRALRLNPSLAFIWALSATTCCYVGEPDAALRRLERYRDLAPFDPYGWFFEGAFTLAYTIKGDYEQAVSVGRRAAKTSPDFTNGYKPLIASLGHLGRREEAKPYIDKLLSLEPSFTIERFGQVYPFKHASDRERYMMGLRLAGVPER